MLSSNNYHHPFHHHHLHHDISHTHTKQVKHSHAAVSTLGISTPLVAQIHAALLFYPLLKIHENYIFPLFSKWNYGTHRFFCQTPPYIAHFIQPISFTFLQQHPQKEKREKRRAVSHLGFAFFSETFFPPELSLF